MKKSVALALLGLKESEINDARINEAYRAAMQMNHPDRYAHDERLRQHAEEQCKLINEAREALLSRSWEEDGSSQRYTHPYNGEPRSDHDDGGAQRSHANATNASDGHESDDKHDNKTAGTETRYERPPSSKKPSKPRRDLWKRHKNTIIGICVVAFLTITWLVPAEIPVPGRALHNMREEGEAFRIIYLGDIGDGNAGFQVYGDPEDYTFSAKVKVPDDVVREMEGYIGTLHGEVMLDGSYEYSYQFFFPRQGNLLQSLLTRFGIWNFNMPVSGHIEGLGDPVFAYKDVGFSAAFPGRPTADSETMNHPDAGNVTITLFDSGDKEFTEMGVITSEVFAQLEKRYSETQLRSKLAESVHDDLMKQSDYLSPVRDSFTPTYLRVNNHPGVAAIEPFVYLNEDGSQGEQVYCYALCLIADDKVYSLLGARSSREAALLALDSFTLI